MRSYRCYLLDAQRRIASSDLIECLDDEAAKLRAHEILAEQPGYRGIEVWDLDRRVHIQLASDGVPVHWVSTP